MLEALKETFATELADVYRHDYRDMKLNGETDYEESK